MLSNSILHSILSTSFNTSMFIFCFEWKIHKKNFIHALNASMFIWISLGIRSPSTTDTALKVCLDQNSKPPKLTVDVSYPYMDVIFSPVLASTPETVRLKNGQSACKDQDEPQPMRSYASHRSRQSYADQSLLGMNRHAPDFRNRTRNMKFNLTKKERGVWLRGQGQEIILYHFTSLLGWE